MGHLDPHVDESVHIKDIHVTESLMVVHAECDEHVVPGGTGDVSSAALDFVFFGFDVDFPVIDFDVEPAEVVEVPAAVGTSEQIKESFVFH